MLSSENLQSSSCKDGRADYNLTRVNLIPGLPWKTKRISKSLSSRLFIQLEAVGFLDHLRRERVSSVRYTFFCHEWSFLEGADGSRKHAHTLKAGRHLFPFELRLGGSLPSWLATYVNGGASISSKLRATAIRTGLSSNLALARPITLLWAFALEALDYQQTLEIENTWPEKLMYALMLAQFHSN